MGKAWRHVPRTTWFKLGLQGPLGQWSYFTASLRNGTNELASNVTWLLRLKKDVKFVTCGPVSSLMSLIQKVTKTVKILSGDELMIFWELRYTRIFPEVSSSIIYLLWWIIGQQQLFCSCLSGFHFSVLPHEGISENVYCEIKKKPKLFNQPFFKSTEVTPLIQQGLHPRTCYVPRWRLNFKSHLYWNAPGCHKI